MTRRMTILLHTLFISLAAASAYYLEAGSMIHAILAGASGISVGSLIWIFTDMLVDYRHARRLNSIMNLSIK